MAWNPSKLVWYVSYGSNMCSSRLGYYLAGGTLPGTARTYAGCRDPRPPRRTSPATLPGTVYFALESTVWTGGTAFYDPTAPGSTAARAYLLTAGQFADVVSQEMRRTPGEDLDLSPVLATGRAQLGPGRYETLVLAGHRDGCPLLTFTAPWGLADVRPAAPAAAYLTTLAAGLREAHGWTARQTAEYLAALPGARGAWRLREIEQLVTPSHRPVSTQSNRWAPPNALHVPHARANTALAVTSQ